MPFDAKRAVANGQASYKSGNLVEASQQFKAVAKSCSCQAGKATLECACSDFLAACKGHTLDAALRTPCRCPRRAHQRCKDELHITALASLVMVAVKAKDHKLGLIYGQNLIRLAPRDPKGYLRLGQVLRCVDKHHTALAVYQQGIALVARANPDHAGLQALKEQERITTKLLSQVDPLEVLPAELLVLVLSHLDTRHHCRCIRLSKSWKSFMVSRVASSLWTCQHFDRVSKKPPKILKPGMVQKYLSKYPGGQLRSLTIDDCTSIPLVRSKLPSVLRLCPQLQTLSLGGAVTLEIDGVPRLDAMPQLKFLRLDSEIIVSRNFVSYLITASRETMEELVLFDLSQLVGSVPSNGRTGWPELPRLRTLDLAGHGTNAFPLNLMDLTRIAPNLQDLRIQFMALPFLSDANTDALPEWPHLKRLHISHMVKSQIPKHGTPWDKYLKRLVQHREKLTELVLSGTTLEAILATNTWDVKGAMPVHAQLTRTNRSVVLLAPDIPNLERVVLETPEPLTSDAVRLLLEPSLKNDTLRHLSLHPFPWSLIRDPISTGHWLSPAEEATGITALTISCLNGEVGRDVDNPDDALLRLVGLFPNLHELDIGSEAVQPHTLGRILKGGVQNIYHRQGASMLELKDWAQSMGKSLIQGSYFDTARDF